MRYLKIYGVYEVQWRPEVKSREWRVHVVDGNSNGVMIEIDSEVLEKIIDMVEGEKKKGARGGEVVE